MKTFEVEVSFSYREALQAQDIPLRADLEVRLVEPDPLLVERLGFDQLHDLERYRLVESYAGYAPSWQFQVSAQETLMENVDEPLPFPAAGLDGLFTWVLKLGWGSQVKLRPELQHYLREVAKRTGEPRDVCSYVRLSTEIGWLL